MKTLLHRIALPLLLLMLLLSAGPARAAASCGVSVTPLAFGPYASPGGAQVDSSASVQLSCTPEYLLLACKTSYTLSLSLGIRASGNQRRMAATVATGTGYLGYGLFSDSQRQQPWGDGGASGVAVGGTITTSLLGLVCLPGNRSHTVYGRIPASQNVPAGSYADSVVLTVTY